MAQLEGVPRLKAKNSKISATLVSSGQSSAGARGYFGPMSFRQHLSTPRWYLTRNNGVIGRSTIAWRLVVIDNQLAPDYGGRHCVTLRGFYCFHRASSERGAVLFLRDRGEGGVY